MSKITELASRIKKEKFARILLTTNDVRAAFAGAGFKNTDSNFKHYAPKLTKDPFVQKTIKELLEEMYPIDKRAGDLTQLLEKAVTMAKDTDKLNEVLAAIQTLAKIVGAEPPAAPQTKKHLHLHAKAPEGGAIGVASSLQLPKK